MDFDFVSLVAAGDDPMARVVISKAEPSQTQEESVDEISKDDLPQEVVDYIEALEAENDTLSKELVDAQSDALSKSAETMEFEELLEKADPAVRELIKKQAARAEEAEKIAKAERDARLDKEFLSKAEAMPMISEDRTALGGLLRRISEALTADDSAQVEKMLTTANEQIAKGNLFGEVGSYGETTIAKSVDGMAAELRKADPSLTLDMARAKVYEENPALFAEAMNQKEA